MNIALMLEQFEEMMQTSPEERTQRELDKLNNIAEVNRPEATAIGLAQCCAYARFVQSKSDAVTVRRLFELVVLMGETVGITLEGRVERSE